MIKKISLISILFLLAVQFTTIAQEPVSFEQAKSIASNSGRSILLEFFRDG